MKVVLATFNASYSHVPLALYALKAHCAKYAGEIAIESFTASQPDEAALDAICKHNPVAVGFSCYVWNIEKTLCVAYALKKRLPGVLVIFGGPEVSGNGGETYLTGGFADIAVTGEGEKPLFEILDRLFAIETGGAIKNGNPLKTVNDIIFSHEIKTENKRDSIKTAATDNFFAREKCGVCNPDASTIACGVAGASYLYNGRIVYNPTETPAGIFSFPFPYPDGFHGFIKKTLYYEASRGCPFKCAYCMSSLAGTPRRRELSDVFAHLKLLMKSGARRVKFVDRTFNADEDYATAIWDFLTENDDGSMSFHFEAAAELLGEKSFASIGRARPGYFQFEAGIQSTDPDVLQNVGRHSHIPLALKNIKRLAARGNAHTHVSLIAGLPGDRIATIEKSFNDVCETGAAQIQLGFLKVLKGTRLWGEALNYGIACAGRPPYEIIKSDTLSEAEVKTLKVVAWSVDSFRNTGFFAHTVGYLLRFFNG
ncbi:MAG: B12-binding domain-containing radical SAM protein, partial [Defluviitaleaceae bacterium]|nr:B12-binding domain-containing radical SAM protein [Defluviitaleaceae bacterium]